MVDTVDGGEEEHFGVNPISSTGDGETAVSRHGIQCGKSDAT